MDHAPKPRCLVVRPEKTEDAGGDEVVYRRSLAFLAERFEFDQIELASVSRARKFANILTGRSPPELARYICAANIHKVAAACAAQPYAAVLLFNEVTFPSRSGVPAGVPVVQCAHNTHSVVARSETSRLARLFLPVAERFERCWYADPTATLVCISQGDLDGLAAIGIIPQPAFVAPPGAPPEALLAPGAGLVSEALLTGSYGWWRKRRDLEAFAAQAPIGPPIYAPDVLARAILSAKGWPLLDAAPDLGGGVRFGLVTDRFLGGFKLKSLEYVAQNCIIVSLCDLRQEFKELPHAEEFVRFARNNGEVAGIVRESLAAADEALVERFRLFKAACLARFAWSRCLEPLAAAIDEAIG